MAYHYKLTPLAVTLGTIAASGITYHNNSEPPLSFQSGSLSLFYFRQYNNNTSRCMHSLVFVTIFRNSVFLFPNYGTLTKTEIAGTALNFFCISSIHFIRFYSALQLPSDCPPTALRVSFRYPRASLFIFASVIISRQRGAKRCKTMQSFTLKRIFFSMTVVFFQK